MLYLNFDKIQLRIVRKREKTFEDLTSVSCETNGFNDYRKKNEFDFFLKIKEQEYRGKGVNGNDALWIPFSREKGLKVITINKKYSNSFNLKRLPFKSPFICIL